MSEKKFSKQHEWISVEGDIATVGITKHASEMLGDVVFVELPEKGKMIEKDGQAGVVESTKAVNKDPEGNAWFFKIKVKNKSEVDTLMNKVDYEKFAKKNQN